MPDTNSDLKEQGINEWAETEKPKKKEKAVEEEKASDTVEENAE